MIYLRKMKVLRGAGELVGVILRSFWWSGGCLEAFWELEAMRLDIGGFEAGKWEAGGCQMEPRVRTLGAWYGSEFWFWGLGGRTYRRGGTRKS